VAVAVVVVVVWPRFMTSQRLLRVNVVPIATGSHSFMPAQVLHSIFMLLGGLGDEH